MNCNMKITDFDLPPSFDELKRFVFPRNFHADFGDVDGRLGTMKTTEAIVDVGSVGKSDKFAVMAKKVVDAPPAVAVVAGERDVFDFDEDDHTDDELAFRKIARTKSAQKTKNKYR